MPIKKEVVEKPKRVRRTKDEMEELKKVNPLRTVVMAGKLPKEIEPGIIIPVLELPTFDNKRVLRILYDGRHTKTHYHCDMEGGVKMHVPRILFNGV